jgi:cell division protein FtsN
MAKKPASLTSDLLARKGDAGPSSVDPVSRVTIAPGRQPNLSGIGAGEDPSQRLYASLATERPEMYGTDEEERPRPPEPEIIYTPEEEDGGGRARLVAGAFVGLTLLGGVIVALSLNDGGSGVAPVAPDVTAIPDEAPAAPAPAQVAQAPAAPETQANPEAAVPGAEESAAEEAPELRTSAEPAAPAEPEAPAASESAPASITPPALQSRAEAPAAAEPAPEKVAAAEPAAPAPVAASGGAYVVQIMALREEGAAKAAWAALQKKHPAILGGHALDIEKADLGDKGTYYRVRAAGFETKADAQSACSSLKSAGQDCLVKAR